MRRVWGSVESFRARELSAAYSLGLCDLFDPGWDSRRIRWPIGMSW